MQLATTPTLQSTDFAGFLPGDSVSRLVSVVRDQYTPYGPVRKGQVWWFSELTCADDLDLEYTSTVLPPKHVFRPTTESLFTYSNNELDEPFATNHAKPAALIGVHACDLAALNLLDEVYSGQGQDPYYARRKANALVVAVACQEPASTCFCSLTNTGPYPNQGFDALLVPTGSGYLVVPGSRTGTDLIASLDLEPVSAELLRDAQVRADRAQVKLEQQNHRFSEPTLTVKEAVSLLTHPHWAEVAERCLGCGACTIVCPTCFCYDIVDEPNLVNSEVTRKRQWDSCLYLRFSEMAGHPSSDELKSRLQQRLYHKWSYHREQFGETGCVGCGRCIESCTARIDPRELLVQLGREAHDLV